MADLAEIERIRNEARHGFTYTLPRTALNDVESLLQHYDAEKLRRERYQATLQSVFAWARNNQAQELFDLLHGVTEDLYAEY